MKILFWLAIFVSPIFALLFPALITPEKPVLVFSRETATTTPAVVKPPIKHHQPSNTPLSSSQIQLKAEISAVFADVPQMLAIIHCESHYSQFNATGSPLISRTDDVGVMQINIPTWGALAEKLGLDIYHSAADNIVMGRIIYERQGVGAWTCSRV